ncbi:MAG: Crp/Fnr family transcriptional regulator [Abitibacteriaceae bacterium]|nr:Crp/Fnr family transcriptional regulator [Abditibacteriaceae bacterium]
MLCVKTVPAEKNVLLMGQANEAVYIILRGTVRVYVENQDGTHVVLGILGSGEIMGEVSAVDSLGHIASVRTLEVSSLLFLDRRTYQECLQTMPPLANNLNRIMARRLRNATKQIQSLAKQDVYARVARQILSFAYQYNDVAEPGTVIPLRLTQTDLANLIGASRVRVNQVLGNYKRNNYISIDGNHRITIHNRAALAKRCH